MFHSPVAKKIPGEIRFYLGHNPPKLLTVFVTENINGRAAVRNKKEIWKLSLRLSRFIFIFIRLYTLNVCGCGIWSMFPFVRATNDFHRCPADENSNS